MTYHEILRALDQGNFTREQYLTICHTVKAIGARLNSLAASALRVNDCVTFDSGRRGIVKGHITAISDRNGKTTVRITSISGMKWRTSPAILKVIDPSRAPAPFRQVISAPIPCTPSNLANIDNDAE